MTNNTDKSAEIVPFPTYYYVLSGDDKRGFYADCPEGAAAKFFSTMLEENGSYFFEEKLAVWSPKDENDIFIVDTEALAIKVSAEDGFDVSPLKNGDNNDDEPEPA